MQTLVRLGERNKLPWTVTDRCLLAATTAVVGREGNASNLQSESGHRRPQLIENTSGFLFKIHAVGDMLFDPERMCWLGNESELEDFDFDFDSDDEPQARDKRADLTEGVESGSPQTQKTMQVTHSSEDSMSCNTTCCASPIASSIASPLPSPIASPIVRTSFRTKLSNSQKIEKIDELLHSIDLQARCLYTTRGSFLQRALRSVMANVLWRLHVGPRWHALVHMRGCVVTLCAP